MCILVLKNTTKLTDCVIYLQSRYNTIKWESSPSYRVLVRVAGEGDGRGSVVNSMTGFSLSVVQDDLIPHKVQNLVGQSCKHNQTGRRCLWEQSHTFKVIFRSFNFIPAILCFDPSVWQDDTDLEPLWGQTSAGRASHTDRWYVYLSLATG